jgi:predicted nuclease of predicted toxin-antitoxin system
MKILFDHNGPFNLRRFLPEHEVQTASKMGWAELANGELLAIAEKAGFDLFITCDQDLSYQQNLASRRIAILELTKNNWPSVAPHVVEIVDAVATTVEGSYRIVRCRYIYTRRLPRT